MLSFVLFLALTGYTAAGDEFFVDGEWREITNNINFPIEHNFLERNLQFRTNRTLLRPNWQHDVKGTDHDSTSAVCFILSHSQLVKYNCHNFSTAPR